MYIYHQKRFLKYTPLMKQPCIMHKNADGEFLQIFQ